MYHPHSYFFCLCSVTLVFVLFFFGSPYGEAAYFSSVRSTTVTKVIATVISEDVVLWVDPALRPHFTPPHPLFFVLFRDARDIGNSMIIYYFCISELYMLEFVWEKCYRWLNTGTFTQSELCVSWEKRFEWNQAAWRPPLLFRSLLTPSFFSSVRHCQCYYCGAGVRVFCFASFRCELVPSPGLLWHESYTAGPQNIH